jgi:hypothetical protein
MLIEFAYNGERIACLVSLESNLIAVSSSLILHDLLSIEVEFVNKENKEDTADRLFESIDLDKLNARTFQLTALACGYVTVTVNKALLIKNL